MDDKKVVKTKRSATKKAVVSPVFNELFRCDVAEDRLASLTLIISVYDSRSAAKADFLGRVVMGRGALSGEAGGYAEESERRVWQYLLSRKMAPTEPSWFALRPKKQLFSTS